MRTVCADCFQAFVDGRAWREQVERCGCAARNESDRVRAAANVAALVSVECPECHAPVGEWCTRHGVTVGGLLLMCPARRRVVSHDRG